MDEYLEAMKEDFAKSLDAFKRELAKVRTGRATPALVDGVQVNVVSYGATMPLNQLATVQAPDPRLLTITPWDKGTLADIERAIIAASLGLNPSNDGKLIRVPVPALTNERRQQLVKQVRAAAEEAKVRARHVRRDYNEIFKTGLKDGDVTEDDCDRLLEQVQTATDDAIAKIDAAAAEKEKEVLEV
jgi:ribosome recycling factor